MQKQIIECVPNFSEGRDRTIIEKIAAAIQRIEGVKLLHVDMGKAANRTVMTFAGTPQRVVEAAFQAVRCAADLIDMRFHEGEHPRIGAVDVCPLVPVANISLEAVRELAQALGERIGKELELPVFLYEANASAPHRKNLAHIRKGEYEGLETKLDQDKWQPDFGPHDFHPAFGAMVLGARNYLIAYNVNLNTKSVTLANDIAREIRESGKWVIKNRKRIHEPGRLKSLKAIGWYIREYDCAQVSMNLTNYKITGMHQAYEACREVAATFGVEVTGSELIGLVPLEALLLAGKHYATTSQLTETATVELAIQKLGLTQLKPFDPSTRVLEYRLEMAVN